MSQGSDLRPMGRSYWEVEFNLIKKLFIIIVLMVILSNNNMSGNELSTFHVASHI